MSDFNEMKPGDISTSLVQVKITPNASGYAGTVAYSGFNDVGHELINSPSDSDIISEKSVSGSMTYSNTATTMWVSKLDTNGETFHVFYLNVDANHVAHNIEMLSMTNDHQNPNYSGGDPNKCTTRASLSMQ